MLLQNVLKILAADDWALWEVEMTVRPAMTGAATPQDRR